MQVIATHIQNLQLLQFRQRGRESLQKVSSQGKALQTEQLTYVLPKAMKVVSRQVQNFQMHKMGQVLNLLNCVPT